MFIISVIYFGTILILKNTPISFTKKVIYAALLSFFIVPLFFPYNPFPKYFYDIQILGNYLFGVLYIGLTGTLIPFIDKIITNRLYNSSSIN